MDRFLAGARNAVALRRQAGLRNSICEILHLFPANGTCYLDMPSSDGTVYACMQEHSLDGLLRRVRALARAVGGIHRAGLLCLDVKPGNLLVWPEDPDRIMLFDLDSAVSRAALSQGAKVYYSPAWAPPEQKLPFLYGEICEATDLYAIGELLFYGLFGRHSRPEERRPSAVPDLQAAPLLAGAEPELLRALGGVLCKLICTAPEKRYQRAGALAEVLDGLLAAVNRKRGIPGDRTAVRLSGQEPAEALPSPHPEQTDPCLSLTHAAVDSGDYGPVRHSARLCRMRAEQRYGRNSPEYLDAVFCEAAACFAQLASSLEDGAIPPSQLTDAFLWLLTEYLALAEPLLSGAGTRRGSLAAFADGLRQTVSLRLEKRHSRGAEGPDGAERALLEMAVRLARYAEDAQLLAELCEMACPLHQMR